MPRGKYPRIKANMKQTVFITDADTIEAARKILIAKRDRVDEAIAKVQAINN